MRSSAREHSIVQRLGGWTLIALFACVPVLANWMIGHVGTATPNGPHVLPVWLGAVAPSGVYAAGLAFSLRDAVHELAGRRGAILAILLGTLASALVAPPALVVASGAAFLLSEALDYAIYAPLRSRGRLVWAVLASNSAGLVVDSVAFLTLAGYGLALLPGQIIGKLWMTLAAVVVVWVLGRRRVVRA